MAPTTRAASAPTRCSPSRSPTRTPRRKDAQRAAVPASGAADRRQARAGDAGADDEHHQRRRARQQQPRHPGIHDPAGGRAELSRSAALRRGDLPHAEEDPARPRARDRGGRRGRLRAGPGLERGSAGDHPRGHRARPATSPARTSTSGLDVASSEFFKDGKYELESEKPQFHSAASSPTYLADLAARYPIITIEDGMAEGDWDGWAMLTQRARQQDPAGRATTCSSPTPRS